MSVKRVRVVSAPQMGYGGALPNTGNNINSPNIPIRNQVTDLRWRYFSPADVYAYPPNPYQTRKTLPEADNPDIKVEKQEQVMGDFDGDGAQELMGVNTGTHQSGNDQGINVPDNSFVFSDTKALRIKDKDILKTFEGGTAPKTPAQLAKKFDLQSMSAIMNNPDSDQMSKKTAGLMYQNYQKKLNQLAGVQEEMKGNMEAKRQMKLGGYSPLYDIGGSVPLRSSTSNVFMDDSDYSSQSNQLPTELVTAQRNPDTWGQPLPPTYMDTPMQPYTPGQYTVPETPSPVYPQGTDSQQGTRRVRIAGIPGINADTMGDIALGLKAATLQKFKPWEPVVHAVIPQAQFMDPTRELANNSEQASIASRAFANSSNQQASRSAASSIQGQALGNAANILSRYNNANTEIGNKANQTAATINNERMSQERERLKSLNSDNFNSNRLYQGELNQLTDEMVKRQYEKEDKQRNIAWINKTNPYIQLDRNGMPSFNGPEAKAALDKIANGQNPGLDPDIYKRLASEIAKAKASGITDEDDAKEAAWKVVFGNRERTTYDKNNMQKSRVVSGPQATKKFGGFTPNQINKFMDRIGR